MSATTAPSNFVEMVLNHLDIIYQCPHYLFDGLSSHAKLTFDDSVKKLVDEMKRENSKVDRCEGEVTSKFESLRHTRMQKFLFAQGMVYLILTSGFGILLVSVFHANRIRDFSVR